MKFCEAWLKVPTSFTTIGLWPTETLMRRNIHGTMDQEWNLDLVPLVEMCLKFLGSWQGSCSENTPNYICCLMWYAQICWVRIFQTWKIACRQKYLGLMLVKWKCSLSESLEQYLCRSSVITYFGHNSYHIVVCMYVYVGLQCGVQSVLGCGERNRTWARYKAMPSVSMP